MDLSKKTVDKLLKSVSLTRPDEVTCGDCLKDLAEFAERSLQGRSVPEGLRAIEHHLAICPECQEEFKALLKALRDER